MEYSYKYFDVFADSVLLAILMNWWIFLLIMGYTFLLFIVGNTWYYQFLGKDFDVGKDWIEDRRRRGQQRMRWLNGITDSMHMNLSILESMWSQTVRHDLATEQQYLIGWQMFSVLCLCTKYYCTTLSILGFCFWMQLSYSETVWSFLFTCLLSLKSYCLSLLDI